MAFKFGQGAPKCTICNKSVYHAEKVEAINRIWHKDCFCCGGAGANGGCKKKLSLDSYLTHAEEPYCKQCHGKLFGPRGYGFGMSAAVLSTYPDNTPVKIDSAQVANQKNTNTVDATTIMTTTTTKAQVNIVENHDNKPSANTSPLVETSTTTEVSELYATASRDEGSELDHTHNINTTTNTTTTTTTTIQNNQNTATIQSSQETRLPLPAAEEITPTIITKKVISSIQVEGPAASTYTKPTNSTTGMTLKDIAVSVNNNKSTVTAGATITTNTNNTSSQSSSMTAATHQDPVTPISTTTTTTTTTSANMNSNEDEVPKAIESIPLTPAQTINIQSMPPPPPTPVPVPLNNDMNTTDVRDNDEASSTNDTVTTTNQNSVNQVPINTSTSNIAATTTTTTTTVPLILTAVSSTHSTPVKSCSPRNDVELNNMYISSLNNSPRDQIEEPIITAVLAHVNVSEVRASFKRTPSKDSGSPRLTPRSSRSNTVTSATKFGTGAPKCTVCEKSVYHAELVNATGRVWHKECFCCGGTGSSGGCKKKLSLDSYLTHSEEPYCKPCHGKLFGPRGFGYGLSGAVLSTYPESGKVSRSSSNKNLIELTTASDTSTSTASVTSTTPPNELNTTLPVMNTSTPRKDMTINISGMSSNHSTPTPAPSTPTSQYNGGISIISDTKSNLSNSSPEQKLHSSNSPRTPRSTRALSTAASISAKLISTAPKCTICNKSVYHAEKVEAINRVWHKDCFCCGGIGSHGGCKKRLTLDSYLTHGEDPFCKPCHGKLFGPRGFGYGLSGAVLSTYPDK